jgi:hypothetical protein
VTGTLDPCDAQWSNAMRNDYKEALLVLLMFTLIVAAKMAVKYLLSGEWGIDEPFG